ncbi:hypothetical protein A2954_04155 [Candidatus Roizmanbacteria bacterium RIFCSPLOWO2_01_FULL_37_12]|uniref:Uncharacterized protein n=1 Tax=Candidatus Roizmanbacteria bacterium RIFCSPLOWO2_01_FULL_37_12 TaxID=1802056 RepID=A0A1F7IFN4_9BACT|nr:MAG: hypothetical protein A3D76_03815 [Candidatus Roizmanbacteria bacterium RIFCSPHIGHO2_02_FULL_37_9b]OGK42179.1 MAG: hypothetical protein A2954_04155 [Candidatus Roizmanbacteria bacterium RIFCSPLOWO2_01_FULL_37_12]
MIETYKGEFFDISHISERTNAALRVPRPKVHRLPNGSANWDKLASDFPDYMFRISRQVSSILPEEDTTDIMGLWTHEEYQDSWIDVLSRYDTFNKLRGDKPKSYLHVINYGHDLYRFSGNGAYSLTFTEGLSGWFNEKIFHSMLKPSEAEELLGHMHSMDWHTGKKPIPDFKTASDPQIISRLIKMTDSISKKDKGKPAHPEEYFQPGGLFDRWKTSQIARKRFPLYIQIEENGVKKIKVISLEEYAELDEFLIRDAYSFTENLTGKSMHDLWKQVVEVQAQKQR